MNRYMLPVAVFAILIILLAVGLTINPRKVPSPYIGKQAPMFNLAQLNDTSRSYTPADFKGEVWAVNVWASWCTQCRYEHKQIFELVKNIRVVGMNKEDAAADANRWLKQLGNPYPLILVDPDGKAGLEWGVYGVPETFIIDKKGIIRYKHIGVISEEDLEVTILPLVNQLKAEVNS